MKDIRRQTPTTSIEPVEIRHLPVGLIRESDSLRLRIPPYPGVEELADDIRRRGQTTPLFVGPARDGFYDLISGYCRLAALKMLKAQNALVRVFRDLDEQEAYDLAINENQARNNLSDFERANICLRLQKEGRTTKQIAERMGWNAESSVFRYLRVAKEAPPPLRDALQLRRVSMGLAAAFLDDATSLPEHLQREALAAAAEHELSVAEFKRHLRRACGAEAPPAKRKAPIRKLKDGGFVLTTRVEAKDPAAIDHAIETLEAALKDARRLRKALGKIEPTSQEEIR